MGEHKRRSQAKAPDGVDAFDVISQRLVATSKPIDSVLAIADQLPAGDAFRSFAMAHALAVSLYEQYLLADHRECSRTTHELAERIVDVTGAPIVGRA